MGTPADYLLLTLIGRPPPMGPVLSQCRFPQTSSHPSLALPTMQILCHLPMDMRYSVPASKPRSVDGNPSAWALRRTTF